MSKVAVLAVFVSALPDEVPKVAAPDETRSSPLFVDEKLPPLRVPPLTWMPPLAGMVGAALNWKVPVVILNNPLVIVIFALLDIAPPPFASSTLAVLVPLL